MKKIQLIIIVLTIAFININAQFKKDGTPDMRYNANKNTYSAPTNNYNTNPNVHVQNTYTKDDGTVVESHVKTNTNNNSTDNFTTKGNSNPYTGTEGTKPADYTPDATNYGSGQNIQTGSKGGQYYINSNGNKVYVPKR